MGKKRSQKDRGYITAKEHAEEWGGFKDRSVSHGLLWPALVVTRAAWLREGREGEGGGQ
jgi:hypothetical protein